MSKQEDLTRVFDRTWMAVHNTTAKDARAKEKAFVDKMFNIPTKKESPKGTMTPSMQAKRLQQEINNASSSQRKVEITNIIKKWK